MSHATQYWSLPSGEVKRSFAVTPLGKDQPLMSAQPLQTRLGPDRPLQIGDLR